MTSALKKRAAQRAVQYAALPWRQTGAGIEVLLITSRQTKRWIIPKGWPIKGLTPAQSAARETFEEAGAGGQVTAKPIGRYEYEKRLPGGSLTSCRVDVYGLEVMVQHRSWPEQGQRSQTWMPAAEAAIAVAEPELGRIIAKLKA